MTKRRPPSGGHMSKVATFATMLAAAAALTIGSSVLTAEPADAAPSGSGTVQGTEGVGLNVRPGPSIASGGSLALLPEGTQVTIDCYADGETINGYWYTSSLWQHITSPVEGYVTDTYLYTGVNGPIPGTPRCGGDPPAPATPSTTTPQLGYIIVDACNGQADIEFKPNSHQVAVWFTDETAWSITESGYACLAEEVVKGYEYEGAHQYWGWVENEIRNHAYAWALHVMRDHANPADIDFDAYAGGALNGASWQWTIDYYETGAPLRLFAG